MTLEHYEPQQLLVPATDSWTAVLEPIADLATKIAGTDFVPETYRGKPAQVAAAILHGRELGLPPLTALAGTHVIKGKPAISAETMRSLVLQAGHDITFTETTSSRCKIRGKRAGQDEWTEVTWTLEDARQAGLTNGTGWKNYPRQMLTARATAELCRMLFADAIHGMRAIEELEDNEPETIRPAKIEQPNTVRRQPRKPQPEAIEATQDEPTETTPPPERKRPTIPRRSPQPEPDPTPKPPPGTAQQDEPRPPTNPTEPAEPGQITAIQMHTKRLGINDDERDYRLTVIAALAGLDKLETSKDLTHQQATLVLTQIQKLRDREALENHLNQLPPF